MRKCLILVHLLMAGVIDADDSPKPVVFDPVPGTGELEIGFWEGEGDGLGGHVRVELKPFKLGGMEFSKPKLEMNLFQLALPYDLRSLNDRTIDCDSKEFYFGEGGGLHLYSSGPSGRDEFPMKPRSLCFLRTGNEEVQLVMKGDFAAQGVNHSFVVDTKLKVGWSYGAPPGQVSEWTMDQALKTVGIPELPRRMDRAFFNGGTYTFIRLEPASREVLETWMKLLPVHPRPEAIVLPDFSVEPPDFWFFQFDDSPESRVPLLIDVYPAFRDSKVFDFDTKVIRNVPDAMDGYYARSFHVSAPIPGKMLFFKSATKPASWIVVFPNEEPNGKIFIYDTERKNLPSKP